MELATIPNTPAQMDSVLRQHIKHYIEDHSWRYLEREISVFVRALYEKLTPYVEDGTITAKKMEQEIKSHIPTKSYIHDYYNGRTINYRYTNNFAEFFSVPYSLTNHDAAQDFIDRINNKL